MVTKKDFLELEMYCINRISTQEKLIQELQKRLQHIEDSYMRNNTALTEFAIVQRKIDNCLAKYQQLEDQYAKA